MPSPPVAARKAHKWCLLLAALIYAGGRGFVAESYAICNDKVQQAGSALPRRAEPTEAERKAARDMLKGSPVGEMGTSIGQEGASTLYTVVGGLFLFMLLLTAAVVSGAIG
ncbi:unnamed protein product [Symbiodinium sp. CCMP2592]|nr:unnamed protein product [Symbiodinium sp. CCMP2592]